MRKLLTFIIISCITATVHAQFTYPIKADTVLIAKEACNAELNLENGTRDVLGFLYNKGNGRTEFRKGLVKVNDSTFIIGSDTLKLHAPTGGSSSEAWKLLGNSVMAGTHFMGTTNNTSLRFRTNNAQRMIIDSTGKVGIGVASPRQALEVLGGIELSGGLVQTEGGYMNYIYLNEAYKGFANIEFGMNNGAGQLWIINYAGHNFIQSQYNTGDFKLQSGGGTGLSLETSSGTQYIRFCNSYATERARFSATNGNFLINTTTDAASDLKLQVDGKSYFGNNIGIGTTSPSEKLDLTGNIKLTGTIIPDKTITAGGTTGNQTINKPAGTVNIAASGTSVTVTNSLVTTSSIIYAVIRTNDATAEIKNIVPSSGSFTINLSTAATAEISIGFIVFN